MIQNLFPTPVGTYKLNRDLTENEIVFIKGQETLPNTGNLTSTDTRILCNHSMLELRNFLESSVSEYFKTVYDPKNNVNLQITQSWINYTEPGQYHHKHAHPNSFVSGVFYPQANRETDRIYFYRDGYQQIKLPPNEWNAWNSDSWWFEVGTGDLVLFPSSLTHMVEAVKGKDTRISLSFNTFLVGSVGDDTELTGLKLECIK